MIRVLLAVSAALALSGCAGPGDGDVRARLSGFPPDRSAFAALPALDAALHARAVEAALEGPEAASEVTWSAPGGSTGGVRILDTWVYDDALLCRSLVDRLVAGSAETRVNDMACWSGTEWVWLRDTATPPALLAPVRALPTHSVRSRTDLRGVARTTRTDPAILEQLNPALAGQRLNRGDVVVLPPSG
jgi:surface antigen